MAEVKKATTASNMVKVKLPRAASGEDNFITASVNGKVYKIQKGVEVEVPGSIAQVIQNSYEAKDQADDFKDSIIK